PSRTAPARADRTTAGPPAPAASRSWNDRSRSPARSRCPGPPAESSASSQLPPEMSRGPARPRQSIRRSDARHTQWERFSDTWGSRALVHYDEPVTTDPRLPQPPAGPVLAIDVGTSSAKAALLDQTGAVLEDAQASLSTTRGPDGRMHQHLDDWQDAVRAVIADCLRGNRSRSPAPSPLAAVSVTGQMQDLVLLDEHGRANPTWAPSIAVSPPPGPDALPPKLLHVARTALTAYAASRTVLFSAAGWVAHALTGDAVCDRLTASTTGLYDPRTDDWIPLQSPDGTAPDTGPRSGPDPLVPAHLRLPRLVDPGIVGPVGAQAA